MTPFSNSASVAKLVIGPDLRVRSCTMGWTELGVSTGSNLVHKRIDAVFPGSDISVFALDVLASGKAQEGIIVRLETLRGDRYLCASLQPMPANSKKPKNVLMKAYELDGQILVDEDTGEILEANAAAASAFGEAGLVGQSLWMAEPLKSEEARKPLLDSLDRTGSVYLGHFGHIASGGRVQLEGAMVLLER